MPSGFLPDWVRQRRGRHASDSLPPPLPPLRSQQISFPKFDPVSEATANSLLFQRLPFDARRRILVETFGNQTIHIDLRLRHPPRKSSIFQSAPNGKGPPPPPRHARRWVSIDSSQPLQWEWWSSVCHRRPSCGRPAAGASREPPEDRCRMGTLDVCCDLWSGEMPGKCFLGVMGWILTCRAAYDEGIHVLFSTNFFFIEDTYLFRRLPLFLPPAYRDSISGIELVWDLDLRSQTVEQQRLTSSLPTDEAGLDPYRSLVSSLPDVLPNLHYLYISLQGRLIPPQISLGSIELVDASETFLRPIDAAARRLRRLRDCRIAIPSSYYRVIKRTNENNEDSLLQHEAIWRDITELASDGGNERGSCVSGYWLCHGQKDMPPNLTYEFW